ncbi:metallophosphoesterase family protein [Sphingobacterium lactis]|uniref:metallophosphoesterase family protein n=1 Tax=Sphingobacterium lactis TaxID=797291 RepID=UPI003EC6ED83
MQIAIVSDIHGNLPAWEAILADIRSRNIGQVYCLGDLVDFAPWDREVIASVRKLGIPCILGNHDERVGRNLPVIPKTKHSAREQDAREDAINYTKNVLDEQEKAYLAELPFSLTLTYKFPTRTWRILLVHAHPNSNERYIFADEPLDNLRKIFQEEACDVLCVGHTHYSYIRPVDGNWAINPGSVGRSKEHNRLASYAILHIDETAIRSEIIQVPFDRQAVIHGIEQSPIPNFYAEFWKQ